jgi:hypothetical protein
MGIRSAPPTFRELPWGHHATVQPRQVFRQMDLPPEVLFHRYFQSRPHLQRDGYRGKADLDRLPPEQLPVALLESLQGMMNEALLHENRSIPEHVDHDRFHFDYIDSQDPNALAFCSYGYSFIGVTIPLLEQLWQASTRLSESPSVTSVFDIQLTDSQRDVMTIPQRIQVAAFRLQLFFVVLHEFTHVVHGHVGRRTSNQEFSNEVVVREGGSLERQACEADADGYGVYLMLANIVDGTQERAHLLDVLSYKDNPTEVQDQALLSSFIIAVAAFFFVRPPQVLTATSAYQLTHPPQAARMNLLMKAVQTWCVQNRSSLVDWMTLDRFQSLMRAVASATWGMNGGQDWSEHVRYLRSDIGAEYFRELEECLIKQVKSLGTK